MSRIIANNIRHNDATADSLSFDSSARVGIGTSSPAVTVHAEAAQAELQLKSTSGTNSAGLRFVPGGETNALYIYADGSRNINIDNHATSIASFRASGGLTFNGDTAAANALDDYEEGTWTPVLKGAGTAGSYTLNVYGATYTKIGQQVHINCYFAITAVNSAGSNYAVIEGMPFDIGSSDIGTSSLQGVDINDTATHYHATRASSASDHRMYFMQSRDDGGAVDLPVSGFGVNDSVMVSMTYIAA